MHGYVKHPKQGDVVDVLFDPKSHKVKLTDEYEGSPAEAERGEAERFKAMSEAPPEAAGAAEIREGSFRRISP
jgi:hypothetical protein